MRLNAAFVTLSLLVPLLAACAGGGGGPTIVLYGEAPSAQAAEAPRPVRKPAQSEEGGYSVQEGDTLYPIARRFGVPIRSLIEANGLVPPYRLATGQPLVIPSSSTHVVKQGETLYGIARIHQVAAREIVRLNHLGPPYTIRPGQTLYLPAPSEPAKPVQIASRPAAATPQETKAPPATPKITAEPLAPPPRPAVATPAQQAPAKKPAAAPKTAPTQVAKAAGPKQVAQASGPRPPRRPAALQTAAIPKPPARSGNFLWPVRGRVISSFGPKAKGLHNDGINIAAPRGTPVKAAENGVVAYSGDELRGFGNLVLIRHADGYMTAYGHTSDLLVKRGQTVRRGQTIAKVGTSGAVSSPQLHFEIRKKKRALDPQRYLGG